MRVALAIALAAAVAGCKKKAEEAAPQRPAPISAEARKRDTEACKVYVEKVCACAAAHPDKADVVERCKYDRALPDALQISLDISDNNETRPQDVQVAQKQYRKIATNCLDSTAKLAAQGCL